MNQIDETNPKAVELRELVNHFLKSDMTVEEKWKELNILATAFGGRVHRWTYTRHMCSHMKRHETPVGDTEPEPEPVYTSVTFHYPDWAVTASARKTRESWRELAARSRPVETVLFDIGPIVMKPYDIPRTSILFDNSVDAGFDSYIDAKKREE